MLRAAVLLATAVIVATTASGQGFNDLYDPPLTPGVPTGATGATACPPARTWDAIDPTATDLRSMTFEGRTLSSVYATRVELISGTDATPSTLVSSTSVSGGVFNFVLAAATAAREGNWYQLCAQPEDSNGRRPVGCGCIQVKRERYARPR